MSCPQAYGGLGIEVPDTHHRLLTKGKLGPSLLEPFKGVPRTPNSAGTLRSQSETDRKPEVPASPDSTLGESSREAQSGRRLLGTNGVSLWLWCCLPQPVALGP